MAAIPWPAGAPQFAEQFTDIDDELSIRTPMDIGTPKVRRRSTRNTRKFNVGFIGTHAQWLALRDFYRVECQSGVGYHTFLHPYENTVQTFRFIQAPQSSNLSALGVTISCVWEQT